MSVATLTYIPPTPPYLQHLWSDLHLESDWRSMVELLARLGRWLFSQRSTVVEVWQLFLRRFHHWAYTRESWIPPASQFSWFTPITITIRCNLEPISRSHFPKGELIHCVGKVKNVWLIVSEWPEKLVRCSARAFGF